VILENERRDKMSKLNIAKVESGSLVDGPGGPRTVVWLQGCSIRCTGCQNWALWPSETSEMMSMEPELAARMVLEIADGQPITITGGEPFDQSEALGEFVEALKRRPTSEVPHVIVYTGYSYAYLLGAKDDVGGVGLALSLIDVLVDGQYKQELDHPRIQWRGSENQRVIDLQSGRIPMLITSEWDIPTIEIIAGEVFGTAGLLRDMDYSEYQLIPRCGEFGGRSD